MRLRDGASGSQPPHRRALVWQANRRLERRIPLARRAVVPALPVAQTDKKQRLARRARTCDAAAELKTQIRRVHHDPPD